MTKWYFSRTRYFMKMERKQCIKCNFSCCSKNSRSITRRTINKVLRKVFGQLQKIKATNHVWTQKINIILQRLWREPNLWAQQDKIKLQSLWRKSNLWAQSGRTKMQRLWQKPGLWAREEKIIMQRLWQKWNLWAQQDKITMPMPRLWWKSDL